MTNSTHAINARIQYVPITTLKAAAYNPRRHSKEDARQLRASIERFGFLDPIIANSTPHRKNVVIGGHFRLTVAKEIGFSTVPVVYVCIPDIEREKELNLRLNRNTGEWDLDKLKLFKNDFLFDVGFSSDELSDLWATHLEVKDDEWNEKEEIKKAIATKIRPGDLFAIGEHRIMCGNSLDPQIVRRLVGTTKIDLFNDDVPFNIGLDYDKGVGGTRRYGGTTNDSKSDEEYRNFIRTLLHNALSVAKRDAHIVMWCDERYVWLFQTTYRELGIDSKRLLVWVKNNFSPTPANAFNKITEFAVYGTVGSPYLAPSVTDLHELSNKEFGTGNQLAEEITDHINLWMVKRLPGKEYSHPTEKSPTLHEKALRRCTRPGDSEELPAGAGSFFILL